MSLLLAIDPGTGSSSPTGIAVIDLSNKTLVMTAAIWPDSSSKRQLPSHLQRPVTTLTKTEREELRKFKAVIRTKEICEQTLDLIKDDITYVAIESFVMYGQSGETLQRFIGAMLTRIPDHIDMIEVGNTNMKKYVSGTGKGDKGDVARGLLKYFAHSITSIDQINQLIATQEWDRVDAIGIGITAIHKLEQPVQTLTTPGRRRLS